MDYAVLHLNTDANKYIQGKLVCEDMLAEGSRRPYFLYTIELSFRLPFDMSAKEMEYKGSKSGHQDLLFVRKKIVVIPFSTAYESASLCHV
jgi:hypothetical protein